MRTYLSRITGLVWLVAGLWLAVTAITEQVPHDPLPALIVAGYAAFAAFAGYSLFRGRRWALWPLVVQASLLAALSVGFFVQWGFGWNHGSADWTALLAMLFAALTIGALLFGKRHEKITQQARSNPSSLAPRL